VGASIVFHGGQIVAGANSKDVEGINAVEVCVFEGCDDELCAASE